MMSDYKEPKKNFEVVEFQDFKKSISREEILKFLDSSKSKLTFRKY